MDVSKAHLEPNWKVLRPKGGLISLSLPKTKLELKSDGCINAPRHSTLPVSEDSNWVVESEKVLVYCCYDSVCFICLCTFFLVREESKFGSSRESWGQFRDKRRKKKKNLNSYAFWNCISWGGMRKCNKLPLQAEKHGFKILPNASFHLKSHFGNAIVTLCSKTLTQSSIWWCSWTRIPSTNIYVVNTLDWIPSVAFGSLWCYITP